MSLCESCANLNRCVHLGIPPSDECDFDPSRYKESELLVLRERVKDMEAKLLAVGKSLSLLSVVYQGDARIFKVLDIVRLALNPVSANSSSQADKL